jgi:hypothetical protein
MTEQGKKRAQPWTGQPDSYGLRIAPGSQGLFESVMAAKKFFDSLPEIRAMVCSGAAPKEIVAAVRKVDVRRSVHTIRQYIGNFRRFVDMTPWVPAGQAAPVPETEGKQFLKVPQKLQDKLDKAPPITIHPAIVALFHRPKFNENVSELRQMQGLISLQEARVQKMLDLENRLPVSGTRYAALSEELRLLQGMYKDLFNLKADLGRKSYQRARQGLDVRLENRLPDVPERDKPRVMEFLNKLMMITERRRQLEEAAPAAEGNA